MTKDNIPGRPENAYDPATADRLLSVADSYLKNADRLIYSYGSKTFLAGYDLFDPEYGGRGNIDCSTFVIMVLADIPYEDSPYASGRIKDLSADKAFLSTDEFRKLADFSALPAHYTGIAERIGRPYLAGPKGLDLKKAAALGITVETLGQEIRASGIGRRSVVIARHFLEKGECFSDPAYLKPADLVFYENPGFFTEGGETFRGKAEITHVGIVSADTELMFHSSGHLGKAQAEQEGLPAIALAPVFGARKPAFFARPLYRARKL